ncbi:gas vesicle protein GvpG [Streptomyces sp. NPDC007172]|uniref:gas vesicle protein GvpG n=1 Tax=unclassified Streptomyces TaxID=2593676 RepID=UPI00369519CE
MGFVSQLLTLPMAPLRGTFWVLEQVTETAEREYYDPEKVRQELAVLEGELLAGRIDEDEHDRREDELLDRMEEFKRRQQQLG